MAEGISYMEKVLQVLEEGAEAFEHMESLRATLKKVMNWKTPGKNGVVYHAGIMKI